MRAALFHEFGGAISVETVADPSCSRDGVIVEVKACGVCRSDHHAWRGADPTLALPHVMGHEMAGIVAEAGPESGLSVGQRVTAPFIFGCGTCSDCLSGEPTICGTQTTMGFHTWGAFAQYLSVPNAPFNCVEIPEEIGFVQAAGMGCRVTTAYRGIVDRGRLAPGEWVCIHGCGGIGLSAVMIAKAIGAFVLAVDINAGALKIAQQLGADVCLNAANLSPDALSEAIFETSGGGAHVSVDALGHTSTFHASLNSLRVAGRHVQIGFPTGTHAEPTVPLLKQVYERQISIIGTRGMGAQGFHGIFDLATAGLLDLEALVSERIALDDLGDAIAEMDRFTAAGVTVVDRFD
ncbi:MAG TPA: alcohol dehydrogenase catalytic domain-containing protein [Marivita sp.]|nr:alcohol dehydrogenase catalytic domain-containing protein [Marivita sp.]